MARLWDHVDAPAWATSGRLDRRVPVRSGPDRVPPAELLVDEADRVARACYDMAVRFHRGGRLIVFGTGSAATDAQHIAVEFVHPVIVGKPALPAFSLTGDVASVTGVAGRAGLDQVFAHQLGVLAAGRDIALGVSADGRCASVLSGLVAARGLGLLTVALVGGDGGAVGAGGVADHVIVVRSWDPRVVKEVHVTAYHVLWELVHVFLEQPGLLGPEVDR
jgi:D-sedoheptulose 7-phosphate isomerase